MQFLIRTSEAFGENFIKEIQSYHYVIVGCGGTGALFAEILVRTGAKKISLIDGDKIEVSNLNRVIGFTSDDVRQKKVDVLSDRLKRINSDVEVKPIDGWLREPDPEAEKIKEVRDTIYNSNVVVIAIDNNKYRKICEDLCHEDSEKKFISIGVYVDEEIGSAGYECVWKPKTPLDKLEEEGYGNGSYASIVIEATSVAFAMLLHHLKNPNSNEFRKYFKSYKNFVPQKELIN